MIGVVKHFPGLGHANGDTDTGPATDPPLSELEGDDLIPFEQAIAAHVPVVMMSNVTEPDWGKAPASLNAAAYAYLRHIGFNGVILTDSLDAGAISAIGIDGARAVVEAIEAGADMAMITTATDYPGALSPASRRRLLRAGCLCLRSSAQWTGSSPSRIRSFPPPRPSPLPAEFAAGSLVRPDWRANQMSGICRGKRNQMRILAARSFPCCVEIAS